MKLLIMKVTSKRKLTTSFSNELLILSNMIFIEINYNHKTQFGKTLKCH